MGGSAGAIGGMAGGKAGGMVGSIANYVYTKKYVVPMLRDLKDQAVEDVRREGRRLGGQQMVGYAKAGVRPDVGTPLQVMASTAARNEMQALRTLFEYESKIFEAKTGAAFSAVSSMMMMGGSLGQGVSQMRFGGGSRGLTGAYGAERSAAMGLPYYGRGQGGGAPGGYTLPSSLQYNLPSYQR